MPKPESNRPRKREPVIPESQSDNDAVATKYHKSVEEKEFLKKVCCNFVSSTKCTYILNI